MKMDGQRFQKKIDGQFSQHCPESQFKNMRHVHTPTGYNPLCVMREFTLELGAIITGATPHG
jgi:hypothetical protein